MTALNRMGACKVKRLGELLLENGDIQISELTHALHLHQAGGGLIGRILQEMGVCNETTIARALLHQARCVPFPADEAQNRQARSIPLLPSIKTCPGLTVALLAFSDLFCLSLSVALSGWLRYLVLGDYDLQLYLRMWPIIFLFMANFVVQRLYPLVAVSSAEELRRISMTVTAVYVCLAAATFLFNADSGYSRFVFFVGWVLSLLLVPAGRALLRHWFARREWWGYPTVILGAGKTGRAIATILRRHPSLGLKPVAILDDRLNAAQRAKVGRTAGVPFVGGLSLAPILAKEMKIAFGVVAMPGMAPKRLLELLEEHAALFSHLVIVPNLFGFSSLQVPTKDLGGVLGVEVRQQLLLKGPRLTKRAMDLLLAGLGGLLVAPVLGAIALLIKLDSSGPAFYIQRRMGQDQHPFNAVKFRTMNGDGEKRLQEILTDERLSTEYAKYHKLQKDPRVTRIGYFLRKYRIDEIPQLWNVLRGEMSLVGPRPYLERELNAMENKEKIIMKVLPGMTGMWQVCEDDRTSFRKRLQLDVYYVRNWSPWLDLHLIGRTFRTVVKGTGV